MGLPLVTKAEYKAHAGITSTTQDTIIDSLIPRVSALVKSVCRRTFIDYVNDSLENYFEGGEYFTPSEYPVLSISSLEYSSDYGQTYTEMIEFTDYVFKKSDETIRPVSVSEFPEAINGYKLTFTAGYETLPEDLKLAVFDLITYYMKNDGAIHSNKAPGTNSVQIEYVTTTNLPAHIKRVLDLYTANYN